MVFGVENAGQKDAGEPSGWATVPDENPPKEVPLVPGPPIVGHTFQILKDPIAWGRALRAKHGNLFAFKAFGRTAVSVSGAAALEQIWLDRSQDFSSAQAYGMIFGHLSSPSVLMMDFDEHRYHRQLLNPAFKAGSLKGYLAQMNKSFAAALPKWGGQGEFQFYPAIKALTLDVATEVFLGFHPSDDNESERLRVARALNDMLGASLALVRLPLPGTRFRKSLKAEAYIDRILKREILARRALGGADMFSRLCALKDLQGNYLPDNQIAGHLKTIWIAGHDTLASSLTTLICQLGLNPDWQDRLLAEISELPFRADGPTFEEINLMDLSTCAFKEALRMMPAAVDTPRVTVHDVVLSGYRIPKGTRLSLSLYNLHNDPEIWPDPEKFDPMRFAPGAPNGPRGGHRMAWAPFGGGAHKCIGMNFALIQARAFLVALLPRYRIELAPGYKPDFRLLPIPHPKDGLPIRLIPR